MGGLAGIGGVTLDDILAPLAAVGREGRLDHGCGGQRAMRPQRHGAIATYGHLMNYDAKNISNLIGNYRSAGKNGDIRELCAGILAADRHDVFILAAAGAALAGEQHCHPSIA